MKYAIILNAIAAAGFVIVGSYQFAVGNKEAAKVYLTIAVIASVVSLVRFFLLLKRTKS